MKCAKLIGVVATLVVGVALADGGDIVSVKGKGVGADEASALKDAYRDAVETAVGLYVDAEQMMKNEEIIKDEILTQSNAYIEKFEKISQSEKDGLVSIKIIAKVRKQALTKRIEGCMPAKVVSLGNQLASIHAQSITKETRGKDGVALFRKELSELDKLRSLYELELASPEGKVVESRSAQDLSVVEIDYFFRLQVNAKRFFDEFVPRLDQILSQVSIEEPRVVRFSCSTTRYNDDSETAFQKNANGSMIYGHKFGRFALEGGVTERANGMGVMFGRIDKPLPVVLITQANDSMTVIRGKRYLLDVDCANEYLNWSKKGDSNGFNSIPDRIKVPNFVVSFLDDKGQPVSEGEVVFVKASPTNSDRRELEGLSIERLDKCWMITPWLGGNAKSYLKCVRFKLPKDDLPNIKSIKVEVAN